MKKILKQLLLASLIYFFSTMLYAEPVLMSPEWGEHACKAWNDDQVLTTELVESGWVNNDLDRGYKVITLYRTDCAKSKRAQLKIGLEDEKAKCIYGGGVVEKSLSSKADYIMHANTQRWIEMGSGKYGPMKAMMMRRLKFKGPKMEAMGNMGPFKNFLLLAGAVPSDTSACP